MLRNLALSLLALASTSAFAITPKTGIWWNPNESGRGYVLEVNGNTLVTSIYAYDTSGHPLWYLASGTLTNNGADYQATLNTFSGGQCLTCDYTPATPDPDSSAIAIHFSSNTSGVVTLPGGRQVDIQPFFAVQTDGVLGGLPISFGDIDMLRFDTVDEGATCQLKLTYRNSGTAPITPFLYFNVIDPSGTAVAQIVYNFNGLAAGATVQGSATISQLDGAPSACEGFSLRFNQNASGLF